MFLCFIHVFSSKEYPLTESILPQPSDRLVDPGSKILTLLAHASLGRRLLPTVWIMDDGRCSCMLRESVDDKRICSRSKAGKHPRISEWQKRASCDEGQIIEWHQWQPHANWGWLQDRTFTLDVDPKRGGLETLAQWEEETGGPEYTLRQITQSGGVHLIYEQPPAERGGPIRVQGDILPGIEVRGQGSYIMVDPSRGWTLANPDVLPRQPDDDTLRLIHTHGIDVEGIGSANGSGANGKSGVGRSRSSGKSSDLPATLWFMKNGFGGFSGSRNIDAYRLSWRLLAWMDRDPQTYTREYVAGIMKQCWLVTEQGESIFDWSEVLGAMNSAWKRRERQKKETTAEQTQWAKNLTAGAK